MNNYSNFKVAIPPASVSCHLVNFGISTKKAMRCEMTALSFSLVTVICLMLHALRPIFIIAGKANFRLEAGENKEEIKMKVEKIIYCHCQEPRHLCRTAELQPESSSERDSATPRLPLTRSVTNLEPGGATSVPTSQGCCENSQYWREKASDHHPGTLSPSLYWGKFKSQKRADPKSGLAPARGAGRALWEAGGAG